MKQETEKERKIDFKHNLKVYYEIAGKHKGLFVAVALFVFIVAIATVAEKYLFKVLIDEGTSFSSGVLAAPAFVKVLLIILAVFVATTLTKAMGNWMELHLVNGLVVQMIYDLKTRFFNHIVDLDHNFHTTHRTGSMISRITRGSRAMESITDFIILNLLPLVMQLIIIGASIWYFDFTSAMVIFVTALMFIIYSLFIVSLQNKTRVKANDAEDREKANIGDTLLNIDSIKYFGKENRIKKVFSNFAANTRDIFLINWNYYRWLESGQAIILGIGVFFLIYFPIKSFLAGQLTIGTLAFIYTVYLNISAPLFGFVWGFRRFYEGMADFQALF